LALGSILRAAQVGTRAFFWLKSHFLAGDKNKAWGWTGVFFGDKIGEWIQTTE
jgi:hypothetical protein